MKTAIHCYGYPELNTVCHIEPVHIGYRQYRQITGLLRSSCRHPANLGSASPSIHIVIGGGRKGIRPKRARKSPTLVGTSESLNKGITDVKFERQTADVFHSSQLDVKKVTESRLCQ